MNPSSTFRNVMIGSLMVLSVVFLLSNCKKDDQNDPQLGKLKLTPQETLIYTNTPITASIKVPAGITIGDTIRLLVIGTGGETEIGFMLDNGNLNLYGDEIKGDRVYSGKATYTASTTGQVRFKAVGKKISGTTAQNIESDIIKLNVFNDISSQDIKALFQVQNQIATELNTHLAGNQNNAANAIAQVFQWIKNRPEVESATLDDLYTIEIKYKSGLMGGAVFSLLDEDGLSDTRGGIPPQDPVYRNRAKGPTIPIEKQTRGTDYKPMKGAAAFDPNTIGNRNVFIFAAYEAAWRNNERPHIINILDSLACGDFKVTYYTNQNATIACLSEMTNYGTVVLSTHGSGGGKSFLTGEIADTLLDSYHTYKPQMQGANPKIGISKNIVISKSGTASSRSDVYKVYASFISALPGTFPQSVILNNSCGSDKTPPLRDAFLGMGAKTYFGYTEIVNGAFCVSVSRDYFTTVAKNNKTTGEVSKINAIDPQTPHAIFKIRGSGSMRYALTLVNSGFEDGVLGWTRAGDGRVISQLGSVSPVAGNNMGIISTGLGYTTQTGNISQSFTIPNDVSELSLKWNFLSEEFLEYIGSQFQDRFQIKIISEEGGVEVLFSRTIDGIAAQFGASAPTTENPDGIPGELIAVSPGIVFDQGGVFMTGWQTATFNIANYKGKCVTLVLECTDVGDSIYDTAILLDEIKLN